MVTDWHRLVEEGRRERGKERERGDEGGGKITEERRQRRQRHTVSIADQLVQM